MQPLFQSSKLLVLAFLLFDILFVDQSHQSSDQLARVEYLRELIAQAQSELAQLSALERSVQPEQTVLERAPGIGSWNPFKKSKQPQAGAKLRQWFASIAVDLSEQIELRASPTGHVQRYTHKYRVDVSSLRTVNSSPNADGGQTVDVEFNVKDKSSSPRSGQSKWNCVAQISGPSPSNVNRNAKARPFRLLNGKCDGLTRPGYPFMDSSEGRILHL